MSTVRGSNDSALVLDPTTGIISSPSRRASSSSASGASGASSSSAAPENPNRALLEKFFLPRMVESLEDRDIEALFSEEGLTFRDSRREAWTIEIVTIAEKTDRLFVKAYTGETFSGVFLREMVSPMSDQVIVTEAIRQGGEISPSRDQSVVRSLLARKAFSFEEALADIQERMEPPEAPSVKLDEKVETFIKDCLSGEGKLNIEALFSGTSLEEIFELLPIENKLGLEEIFNKIPAPSQEAVKKLITDLGSHEGLVDGLKQLAEGSVRAMMGMEEISGYIRSNEELLSALFRNTILSGVLRPMMGQALFEREQALTQAGTVLEGRQEELNAFQDTLNELRRTLDDRAAALDRLERAVEQREVRVERRSSFHYWSYVFLLMVLAIGLGLRFYSQSESTDG